jgi:hypothetical protein
MAAYSTRFAPAQNYSHHTVGTGEGSLLVTPLCAHVSVGINFVEKLRDGLLFQISADFC